MSVNVGMWKKALQVIPRLSKEEWMGLDVVSKWLVATRSAVLIMTFISAAIAGILALRDGKFSFGLWFLLALGLVLAHATNNLVNDLTDHLRGVDKGNYYRAQYGPQPLEHGLMTMRQVLTYVAVTGLLATAAGAYLLYLRGPLAVAIFALGVFFVLFYTFPLKYIGLGELTVLLVWGPLMIGGGYYVITGAWNWNVVLAGLPYALGVTTVLFGKHIDKIADDKAKGIHTLPVIIGERAARYTVLGMIVLQYLLVLYLVATGFFTVAMLVVLLALNVFRTVWPVYLQPRPTTRPDNYPAEAWPLYLV
ncbi:MAG: prenyltransferase, partial [Anaerolineae bacterium]|nr:prenyltransferase [Anaerolineae bacterium]